jgi:hypothetical protein
MPQLDEYTCVSSYHHIIVRPEERLRKMYEDLDKVRTW